MWLWEVLESMSRKDKVLFLLFTWARSTLPSPEHMSPFKVQVSTQRLFFRRS